MTCLFLDDPLVVVAVLVSWVMARADRQPRSQERSAQLAERLIPPGPPPKSPNEKLADSLNSLREAIREKAAADVQAMRDQLEDANDRLAAARQLADRLGISSAMTRIAEEMRHWPSWSKGENFSECLVEGLAYSGGHGGANEFVMRGTPYRLWLTNEHYSAVPDSMTQYAEVKLERSDGTDFHPVFAAEISTDGMREFAHGECLTSPRSNLGIGSTTW